MEESGPLPKFLQSSRITKAPRLDTTIIHNNFQMKTNPAQSTFSMHSIKMLLGKRCTTSQLDLNNHSFALQKPLSYVLFSNAYNNTNR